MLAVAFAACESSQSVVAILVPQPDPAYRVGDRASARRASEVIRQSLVVIGLAAFAAALALWSQRDPLPLGVPEAHTASETTLRSTEGRSVTLADPQRPTLVVFGYIGCADRCPLTLHALGRAVASAPLAPVPRIAFVDIDPQHDTLPALRRYVTAFGPNVVGMTAGAERLVRAQRSLGVRPVASDDLEHHDARIFVVDSRGVLIATLPPDLRIDEFRSRLHALFVRDST